MHTALAIALACLFPTAPEGQAVQIKSLLVVDPVVRAGRSPVLSDPVEHMLVRGKWQTPREGQMEPAFGEGERATWQRIEADDRGAFPDFRRGYAWTAIEEPRERIALLEARGHRHIYINQEPRAGDFYNLGYVRLPIRLRAGKNELLFRSGRPPLRAAITEPPAPIFIETADPTLPDLLVGAGASMVAGIIITNATEAYADDLRIIATVDGISTERTLPAIEPLSLRKVPVRFEHPAQDETGEVELELALLSSGTELHRAAVTLHARQPSETHRRTFISEIDGSVQYFAITPMDEQEADPDAQAALFLSLHGASVEAFNQARSYTAKDWGHIVAPTNRRPFGFDWEDWGRLDALEVLDIAADLLKTDPDRTYLTGHSMGGHGTWHIGVHHPDRFAAIAPSAGWPDFWSYTGAPEWPEGTAVERMLHRSMNASRTRLLDRNLQHSGVYILHGDADDNVPVSQARMMRSRLGAFHTNFAYYERPGAGHWWGRQCVDWPPLFRFLHDNTRRHPADVTSIEFHTVNPGISSQRYWITIHQQAFPLKLSRIEASIERDARRFIVSTENIRLLSFDLRSFSEDVEPKLSPGASITIEIDEQHLELPWPEAMAATLEQSGDGVWKSIDAPHPGHKGPHRAGQFKDAFRNNFILVYGTGGSSEESQWARAKARFDAETFWYRGNGAPEVVADTAFEPADDPHRNVILYGNADTNRAWEALLPDAPIEVRAGAVDVGGRVLEGDDLACLFIHPRAGSDQASVGIVAGSGITGMRLTNQLPYFISGAAYPDWIVVGADMLVRHTDGVRALGYFAPDWSLGDDAAWTGALE